MEKLFKISCIIMTVLLAVILALAFYIGFSGNNPNDAIFGKITVISTMVILVILIVFAVVFMNVGGKLPYKIGFYLAHSGMIVLVVGLIITNLTQTKHYIVVDDSEVGSKKTNIIQDAENGKRVYSFENSICVERYETEYYDEEKNSPKNYKAVIGLYDVLSGVRVDSKTLMMNKPARIEGYKIYLVNIYPEGSLSMAGGGVGLLFKYNPGEYVVLFGFAVTLAGIILSCFSGIKRLNDKKKQTCKDSVIERKEVE